MKAYKTIIKNALQEGGLLDALLALQEAEGYVSENALRELAPYAGVSPAQLYDTASFYSMLRFEKPARIEIRVCRGTACHSGGNQNLIDALENATGLNVGERNDTYGLDWVECLGQCQAAPSMLVNGELYTNVDIKSIPALLGGVK